MRESFAGIQDALDFRHAAEEVTDVPLMI